MESKNKPMNCRDYFYSKRYIPTVEDTMWFPTPDQVEEYAQYRLSFVPPDIEKAIEEKYNANMESKSKCSMSAGLFNLTLQNAARFGYSLSSAQIGNEKKLKQIEGAIRATIVIQNPKGLPFCMEKIKEILTIN